MIETKRLLALKEYQILDTLPEQEYNDIVELASALFKTPISLITLLDSERQWFKAKKGLLVNETKRTYAFCHYAIQNPNEVMVVNDALSDARFTENPLVNFDPKVRFYAGAPLITSSKHAIGTLCIIDTVPRNFSDEKKNMLKILANKVIRLLELRKQNLDQNEKLESVSKRFETTLSRLLEAQETAKIGSWDWDLQKDQLYWSPQLFRLFDFETKASSQMVTHEWQAAIHPCDLENVQNFLKKLLKSKSRHCIEYRIVKKDGSELWMLGQGASDIDDSGNIIRVYGTGQDITNKKQAEFDRNLYLTTLKDMLFSLSHKIRGPLTSCIGLLNILEKEHLEEEDIKKFASFFKVSTLEMDEYVRELITFIHTNSLKLNEEPAKRP
ncbi:PAS domain-containing protein [Aquimarina sp. W85]|uniref:PAS domain-containing protein n=1 Tax=Aquimarina rhodophyticola TaxID=3342246 RepID=UPI00366BF85A